MSDTQFVRISTLRFDDLVIGSLFLVYSGTKDGHLYEKKSLSSAYELHLVSNNVAVRTGFIVNLTKAKSVICMARSAERYII